MKKNKSETLKKDLRVSAYNIYVPLEKNIEYEIIIHGFTGAIDLIQKEIASGLKAKQFTDLSSKTLSELEKRGYITSREIDEERFVVKKIAESIKAKKANSSFMFAVTYNCNFRCTYCFQNNEHHHDKLESVTTFSKEMVDKVFSSMLDIEPDRRKHSNNIILYGGEPFMAENKEIVKYIIDEGLRRSYKFVATTNGYELNHFIDFLDKDKISEVQVTIDGVKERHNKRRLHFSDESTYDRIIENIKLALDRNIIVRLRIHLERLNVEDLPTLINEFKRNGFFENRNFRPYIALLKDYGCLGENVSYMSKVEFSDFYFKSCETNEEMSKFGFNQSRIRSDIAKAINSECNVVFNPVYCTAHSGLKIFDPKGDIYTCLETIGITEQKIGSYYPKTDINTEVFNKWQSRIVTNIKQCSKCKYALFCGGGCAGFIANTGKDILNPNCDEFPSLFKRIVNDVFENEITNKISNQI